MPNVLLLIREGNTVHCPGRLLLGMAEYLAGKVECSDYILTPSCWRWTLRSLPVRSWKNPLMTVTSQEKKSFIICA